MSIIKSIKQVLGLGPAAENHFWDGSVANQLTLKRGTPDAPGAELIKALNGVLSFPNQGQSLTQSGYVKLPGGLIIQWGTNVDGVVTLATHFSNTTYCVVAEPLSSDAGYMFNSKIHSHGTNSFVLQAWAQPAAGGAWATTGVSFRWIAIGY